MSLGLVALLIIVLLFVLFLLGLEIGFSMAVAGFVGFAMIVDLRAAFDLIAQDFYAAFGLGQDNRYISTIDTDGVALASIQGLDEIMQEQKEQIKALEAENAAQRKQLATLETRVSALERAAIPNPIPTQAQALPSNWSTLILISLVVLAVWRQDIKEVINTWIRKYARP